MGKEETIRVWGGCFAPMQLVLFDGEKWSPSLDEINTGSYDVSKLFRSTLNVDVGIDPLSLIVLFDGTLVLPACAQVPDARSALSIFNRHLANLLLGGMIVEEVAPDDVTTGRMNLWGYHRHDVPRGRYSQLSQNLRTARSGPDYLIQLYQPLTISKTRYMDISCTGLRLSQTLPANLPAVLLPACSAFSNELWERALILSWTSIELIIDGLWKELLVGGKEVAGISQKRRKTFLMDTRTWTSAARIELLWQTGHITEQVYALADKARASRNAFVHSADDCSPDSARSAINACLHFIAAVAQNAGLNFDAGTLMKSLDESTSHFRSPDTDESGRLLVQPTLWRHLDPAPGFEDWGDRPFAKIPEIQLQPLGSRD